MAPARQPQLRQPPANRRPGRRRQGRLLVGQADHRQAERFDEGSQDDNQRDQQQGLVEAAVEGQLAGFLDIAPVGRHCNPHQENQDRQVQHQLVGQVDWPDQDGEEMAVDRRQGRAQEKDDKRPENRHVHDPGVGLFEYPGLGKVIFGHVPQLLLQVTGGALAAAHLEPQAGFHAETHQAIDGRGHGDEINRSGTPPDRDAPKIDTRKHLASFGLADLVGQHG